MQGTLILIAAFGGLCFGIIIMIIKMSQELDAQQKMYELILKYRDIHINLLTVAIEELQKEQETKSGQCVCGAVDIADVKLNKVNEQY